MSNSAGRISKLATDGLVQGQNSGACKVARVFIDVDTQRDFIYPQGAAYFRQAGQIAPRLARLFRQARCEGYIVLSTTMCLRCKGSDPNDSCIEGTNGQKKPAYTLLTRRAKFGTNGNTDLPTRTLRQAQQLIFEKRGVNPFDHPKFDRLISQMQAREYVVFGVATEQAVKSTVLGLLARGKQVKLVVDATASCNNRQAQMALRQMMAKGVRMVTTHDLAPRMKPRPNFQALAERFGLLANQAGSRIALRLVKATVKTGDNGNGNGNGHHKRLAKLLHNQTGSGNGKKNGSAGGNGHNGNGHNGNGKKVPDKTVSHSTSDH